MSLKRTFNVIFLFLIKKLYYSKDQVFKNYFVLHIDKSFASHDVEKGCLSPKRASRNDNYFCQFFLLIYNI